MHNRDQDIEYAQGNIESEFYSIDAKLDKFKEFVNNEIKNLPKQYRAAAQTATSKVWNEFHKAVSKLMPDLIDALEAGFKNKLK